MHLITYSCNRFIQEANSCFFCLLPKLFCKTCVREVNRRLHQNYGITVIHAWPPGWKVSILGGHIIGHSRQKWCIMYMCPSPNCFWDRAISLYSTLYRRATCHVLTWVAKCIHVNSGIFENILYYVNPAIFVTWRRNTGVKSVSNISFLSTILEMYSEITLPRKRFGVEHVYIYNFLLRMTYTMISLSTDLSSWDSLHIFIHIIKMKVEYQGLYRRNKLM
jgi:hypothetical protein